MTPLIGSGSDDNDQVEETPVMFLDTMRAWVSRRPGWVVGSWLLVAVLIGVLAPDLTRLAAEGQAKMLAGEAESMRAAQAVAAGWPGEAFESMAVVALHRPGGLTQA